MACPEHLLSIYFYLIFARIRSICVYSFDDYHWCLCALVFSLSVFVYVPVVILVPGSLTGGGKSRQRGARWQLGLSSNRPESRGYSIIESRNRSKLVTVNRRSLVAGSVDTEGDCSSLILFSFLLFLTILFFPRTTVTLLFKAIFRSSSPFDCCAITLLFFGRYMGSISRDPSRNEFSFDCSFRFVRTSYVSSVT